MEAGRFGRDVADRACASSPRALFEKLKEGVTAYAAALASSPDRWVVEQAVREQLTHHKLADDRLFTTYSEPLRA